MSTPLISIIIPSYNYGKFILSALNSVSAQSFTNWECIIIDDGSTDDTKELVSSFIADHSTQKFRYIYIENSGTSVAKNTGIDHSNGRYIQFLDADDILSKHKLAIQAPIIQTQDCALVFSKSIFFEDSDPEMKSYRKYPPGFLAGKTLTGFELLSALIKNNIVTISSPLVHKDLIFSIGKFDLISKNNEDWLFWFRIGLRKPIFLFDGDDRSFTRIRIHPSSAIKNHHKMFSAEVTVRSQMAFDIEHSEKSLDKDALIQFNFDLLALHRVRSMDWVKGWVYILSAFAKRPVKHAPLFARGLFRSFVRLLRKIVPQHGA
jgi:glycosyltransferase involved in cell wall biosynthesis